MLTPTPKFAPTAEAQPIITFINLPTDELLRKLGKGSHKPGSGSAAALLGLVSCALLQTVVSLTKGRDSYKGVEGQLTLANQQVSDAIEPLLRDLLQKDAIHFDRVFQVRKKKKSESDPRRRKALGDKALEELKPATEIPLEIAKLSLDLAEKALRTFDLGFQSARGDSGVAITA